MVEPLFVQCQFQQLALGEPVFKRAPTITLDGYAASHRAVREMKTDGLLPEDTKVRSSKYLNNVIEQDHRHIKSRTNVMPRLSDSGAPRPRFSGIELTHRIRKGQFDLAKLGLKQAAAPAVWNAVLFDR
ncbi:transposase-like protein [Paraburkholderia sp. JPY171]|uniref:DDE-type integrase/transposase/recombinase n=1 Tax=Paraburkholderia atlantica TaxID=2654982 RepID=UPI00037C745C|nr:DDE-type integrase/transposase/recombinase [Paraburkholderia atlantica]MBB5421721.1 transposase-like protein [Paraburkholderia atlantica]